MSIASTENKSIGLCYQNDSTCNLVKYSDYYNLKKEGYSLEKINFENDNTKNNWQESFIISGTPGEESSSAPEEDKEEEKINISGKIRINEIFPNPKNEDEEYIELYNSENFDIDLENWTLRDKSKTGKYVFPKNSEIKSGEYLLVKKEDYKFALNNSNEELTLFDNDGKEISKLSYASSKENLSLGLDKDTWRWSKYLTPNEKNKFEKLPKVEIKKDKEIFAGVYAQFEAKVKNGKKSKYRWDFGDGHKSYIEKPRHKYEKSGKYKIKLRITGTGEDAEKEIKIEVKKFPKLQLEIISLSPNPEGKDSELEWIEIKNNSKKKANLKNWSIASGAEELSNHPIREDFFLASGETKKITRQNSLFSLTNSSGKIELRAPNRKVVDKISYDRKEEKIQEGEIYQKINGTWQWKNILSVENVLGAEDATNEKIEVVTNSKPADTQEILTIKERNYLREYLENKKNQEKNKLNKFVFGKIKINFDF
jgi:PKD repeat protein